MNAPKRQALPSGRFQNIQFKLIANVVGQILADTLAWWHGPHSTGILPIGSIFSILRTHKYPSSGLLLILLMCFNVTHLKISKNILALTLASQIYTRHRAQVQNCGCLSFLKKIIITLYSGDSSIAVKKRLSVLQLDVICGNVCATLNM